MMHRKLRALSLLPLAVLALGADAAPPSPTFYTIKVVRTYPHDPGAFTEGLFYLGGRMYESTGLEGQSNIREVNLDTGKVLRSVSLPPNLFGEGIVNWGNQIVSLTWRTGVGFRWNRADFRKLSEFHYQGEGWALTQNGREIFMSDGTPDIRVLDPRTLKEVRRIAVTDRGKPLQRINELEWVKGEIFANVWMTRWIARIDPSSGKVRGWIDLGQIARDNASNNRDSIPNGIAYDSAKNRLFITGKNWSKLYQIDLVPDPPAR